MNLGNSLAYPWVEGQLAICRYPPPRFPTDTGGNGRPAHAVSLPLRTLPKSVDNELSWWIDSVEPQATPPL